MSVYLQVVDHDELFNSLKTPPIIVNNFDLTSQEDMEKLNDLIYTSYSDDSLEVLPTCDCGALKGEYNVGLECDNCHTLCLSVTERPLESILWIAAPKGVEALINPEVWIILSEALTVSGTNIFEWLVNPIYKVPADKEPPQLKKLRESGVKRGINHFYHHFDEIMEYLVSARIVRKQKVKKRDELLQFIQENRHKIFSKHIPIPSKLAFITEKTPMGVYADTSMTPAVDAIRTVSSIENGITSLNDRFRQGRAMQAISKLAEYYQTFFTDSLGPKSGWFRKHVFGSRLHFSFRAVISSLSRAHVYDECHLPWSLSVMFFKIHLISKLQKRGYTPNECIKFLYEHTLKYHPLLDELFKELIDESPAGGIPIILQRNPTLTRLSAQRLRVTHIKQQPEINTVSLSVLVLAGMNADFDGDALNGMLIHDAKTLKRMERLAPHLGVMDLNQPRALSGHIALPAPVVITIANWVHEGE